MLEMNNLTINGVEFDVVDANAVHFTKQSLSEEEKAQARKNIEPTPYPEYWNDEISAVTEKITAIQNTGGKNVSTFAFITDTHTDTNSSGAFVKILEKVMDDCDIPIYLHGGDFVAGLGIISKEELVAQIMHHKEIFKCIENKGLLALGNHDPAFGVTDNYDSNLSDAEIYNYMFRINEGKSGLVYGDTKTYFFKDIPAQKVRYIVLDCYCYETTLNENQLVISNNKMRNAKLGETQLTWLAQTALDVPNGYSVIICSHVPPYTQADREAIGWTGENGIIDCEVALGIVNACKNKTQYSYAGTLGSGTLQENYNITADFSNSNGEVVCWVAGHTHKDHIFVCDGLPVVSTCNNSLHISTNPSGYAPDKTAGTTTEYAMDFFCVNKSSKKCNIVRLGAKFEDRVFSYSNNLDVILTAQDFYTESIYNNIGYKENTRFDNTPGSHEAASTGYFLTGLIPYNPATASALTKPFYIKGVSNISGSDNNCRIGVFNSTKGFMEEIRGGEWDTLMNVTKLEDGYYKVEFAPNNDGTNTALAEKGFDSISNPETHVATYICFSLPWNGETPIITIGNPIE